MPFVSKPIAHGTRPGVLQHRRRGEIPCPECAEADRRYWREYKRQRRARSLSFLDAEARASMRYRDRRRAASQPPRRRTRLHELITDHMQSLERMWGTAIPMAVVLESVLDQHPDRNAESLRRVFYRMMHAGEIERVVGVGNERRYRLTTNRPAG